MVDLLETSKACVDYWLEIKDTEVTLEYGHWLESRILKSL